MQFRNLGIVSSIEANHKPKEVARAGEEVCIKVEPLPGSTPELYGRHFNHEDMIVSKVRNSGFSLCTGNKLSEIRACR